ncbi:catalase [Paucimonas lemoignei]|jgi:catalase|nr:catalase [Paucimonas lemoignei]
MKHPEQLNHASTATQCHEEAIQCLENLFIEQTQKARIRAGQCPVRRPVFLRHYGTAHGHFEVLQDLPPELCVGLFAKPCSYPAWVRYSCDIPDDKPDFMETVGIGIKLFDVPGRKCLEPDEECPTVDFLLQNHPVFFVKTARAMCDAFNDFTDWIAEHPETEKVLNDMRKFVPSLLSSQLWSVIPHHFGAHHYCKYTIVPEFKCNEKESTYNDPDHLRKDLHQRLLTSEVRLHFMVQLWNSNEPVPVDDAMYLWDEKVMPAVHVATLTLAQQDINQRNQAAYGEVLAFNPWRTLKAHEPVGSIAQARKVVYQASADVRRNYNGQTLGEPRTPRPGSLD